MSRTGDSIRQVYAVGHLAAAIPTERKRAVLVGVADCLEAGESVVKMMYGRDRKNRGESAEGGWNTERFIEITKDIREIAEAPDLVGQVGPTAHLECVPRGPVVILGDDDPATVPSIFASAWLSGCPVVLVGGDRCPETVGTIGKIIEAVLIGCGIPTSLVACDPKGPLDEQTDDTDTDALVASIVTCTPDRVDCGRCSRWSGDEFVHARRLVYIDSEIASDRAASAVQAWCGTGASVLVNRAHLESGAIGICEGNSDSLIAVDGVDDAIAALRNGAWYAAASIYSDHADAIDWFIERSRPWNAYANPRVADVERDCAEAVADSEGNSEALQVPGVVGLIACHELLRYRRVHRSE